MKDLKPQPNHERYLEVLRAMSPADRLRKAFELTEMSRRQFKQKLTERFPHLPEAKLHQLYIKRLHSCRNQDEWERMLAEYDLGDPEFGDISG